MEYIFGTNAKTGTHTLKTKGDVHTDLSGYQETVREYTDTTITDSFYVTDKTQSAEDSEGNCYDWYEIEQHNRMIDRTKLIEATSNIAFVAMAESGTIDGTTAGEHISLFSPWATKINYLVRQIRTHEQKLYQCISPHTSQADWTPDVTPSLWTKIADPSEEWPAWSQPIGSMDTYSEGDKVSHNETNWVSDFDNNVWEPGVYGWHGG